MEASGTLDSVGLGLRICGLRVSGRGCRGMHGVCLLLPASLSIMSRACAIHSSATAYRQEDAVDFSGRGWRMLALYLSGSGHVQGRF